ncbi:UvrD-helicase domain-containing protein [Alteromonas confluentis]|uniref:DNA 3'-5' helicase n=1 Tax=Alteromonas confluentis TaxID=1656094 RepID=A0A1E7ZAP0_9ALTE|nr:UvrD-helicase domain-containing protein [Alteromonas confluentis]OFC70522.1 hypothetical protein BFC18_12225 [Alteromonas confluentis]
MPVLVVHPNILGKFFAKPSISLTNENLVFTQKSGRENTLSLASVRTLFQVKKRFLGYELQLPGAKTSVRYRFLKADNVVALQAAANKIIRSHIKAYLHTVFTAFNNKVKLQYPRDSWEAELRELIETLHKHYGNYKADWQALLSADALCEVEEIASLYPFDMARLRSYHEHMQLKARRTFLDTVESNPLTEEQRLAVLRANDRNLVLAAAGTGKTSVMVAKALDVIDRGLAKPSEILILAYNRAASEELKSRLLETAKSRNIVLADAPQIFTFHGLGRELLQRAGVPVALSEFVENSQRLKQWVLEWVKGYSDENPTVFQELLGLLSPHATKGKANQTNQTNEQATVTRCVETLVGALQAIRIERLKPADVSKRITSADIKPARKTANLLNTLHKAYVSELKRQDCMDFDDLITRAIEITNRGVIKPTWKYVLVDEFQDISTARMALLEAILTKGHEVSLAAVGDDWQSIYRFSGGKLELTTRFGELVGSYTETKLQKTFRYNNSIADTAGQFIMANPEQFRKHIHTHNKVDSPQVFLLDNKPGNDNGVFERVAEVVAKIRGNEPSSTVAVIARYNFLLDETKATLTRLNLANHVHFWSFHKSKGLEADHCIIIGFSKGKNGFPSEGRENALIEALLPALDDYPYSEERRLMYVGITRAKHKCYIIADPIAPSSFVTELLSGEYNIKVTSGLFQS